MKRGIEDGDDVLSILAPKRKKPKKEKDEENKKKPRPSSDYPDDLKEFRLKNLCVIGDGKIEIKKSTILGAGNGLFALTDFKRGDPITEYSGKVLSFKEAQEETEANPSNASHMRDLFCMRWVIDGARSEDGKTSIDSEYAETERKGKGAAAFVNDPFTNREQVNTVFDLMDSKDIDLSDPQPTDRVVFLRASKDINKGDEIFVSYGPNYW